MKSYTRICAIAVAAGCVLSVSGCGKKQDESNVQPSADAFVESTSETSILETTETTKPEPTGFEDYIDETVPANMISFSSVETDDIVYYSYNIGSYYIGRGNPKLEAFLRSFTSNPTLKVEDVSSFEFIPKIQEVYDSLVYDNSLFDIDFVRYICSENNLRLFVDEIPYEYFSDRFPEYIKLCNDGRYNEIGVQYHNSFPDEVGYKTSLIDMDYSDSSKHDIEQISCFRHLGEFNYFREWFAATFPKEYGGAIANGKSVDGKYVWCLTEEQYNRAMEYIHKLPKCENVDILVPETREELIASGIDVEKYDDMCEQLFGGAKKST